MYGGAGTPCSIASLDSAMRATHELRYERYTWAPLLRAHLGSAVKGTPGLRCGGGHTPGSCYETHRAPL